MPHPFPLASAFTGGMRRDIDRTELPGGSAYNMVDFIPDEVQAINAGRGGWTYSGPSLGVTGTRIHASIWYPDSSKLFFFTDTPAGYITNFTTVTSVTGTPTVPGGPPAYHRGKILIPNSDGTTTPTKYDGSTISALSGAPPGSLAGVYKDHSLLANSSANDNRLWFSAAGDPTTWDTTFGWWDTTGEIIGLATTPNSILVFHAGSIERLRGTTPPPGSDMTLEPFFNDGCIDPFSIAYWQQRVVFASPTGIYMTDGVSVVDLTAAAQMKTYWYSLMSGLGSFFSSITYRVAGGIFRNHYIVSISKKVSGVWTAVDSLCVNLENQTMWRFTNLLASAYTNFVHPASPAGLGGVSSPEELTIMSPLTAIRNVDITTMWSPSSSVKHDGDGTNPTPIIETGMYRGFDRLHRRWIESMGKQKWRWAYVDYDLRDAASDNPTAALSYCTTPTGSYTQAGLSLSETTDYKRVRRSLSPTQGGGTHSNMLGLKFAVTGPYATAKLYTLEGDFSPMEIGAL